MAIKVKDAATVAAKYATNAGGAGASYSSGVQNPKTDWAQATAASADAYSSGVQKAISNGRFAKGVAKTGTSGWQAKATSVGASRYTQGVQAGKGNYQTGIAPVLQAIANVTLPPRLPKGDPGNLQRVSAVTTALRSMKVNG